MGLYSRIYGHIAPVQAYTGLGGPGPALGWLGPGLGPVGPGPSRICPYTGLYARIQGYTGLYRPVHGYTQASPAQASPAQASSGLSRPGPVWGSAYMGIHAYAPLSLYIHSQGCSGLG